MHKASHHSVHPHGDGSFHTIDDQGKRVDHEHFGGMAMHLAKHHSSGEHMHIHGHEDGYTTHHVSDDGAVQGPDEHERMGQLKMHVAECMDEE